MEFRILGPVEVVDDGRSVELGPAKQRALLADLLLQLNEVVSRDRLIEDLWGERPPGTAATALHGYISQLRKVLEPRNGGGERRLLLTRPPGYLLALDPRQVDLKRFELLASQGKRELAAGEAAAAATTLAEGLALWRGPPLAEFESVPFATAERLRLEDLFVSTLEDRVDADLALGRHHELVVELEALIRQHPFRERLARQLMLALYRCDRQAEALEVYRRTRRKLVAELGIEPGPGLQEVQQAILRHEQAIAPAVRTKPSKPVATPGAAAKPALARTEHRASAAAGAIPARKHGSTGRPRLLGVAIIVAIAVAGGVAFARTRGHHPSLLLAPNSVGFIDAKSNRVATSFAVGHEPRAVAAAFGSVWVANYRDTTVTRIDRTTGHASTIPVYGHPTSLAIFRNALWVWTLEGLLVPVDPRFETAGEPIHLKPQAPNAGKVLGGIAAGGGFLWAAAPPTTVIRIDPADASHLLAIVPDAGVQGPIDYRDGQVWVAGSDKVFPIDAKTGVARSTIRVGVGRDLAVTATDVWIVSGGAAHLGGVGQALRRLQLQSRLIEAMIPVGSDPISVTAAGDSIWAASGSDGMVSRIDPGDNRVVDSIPVGESPTALAPGEDGVWVAVR